jgi:hypothetical protein
MRTLALPFFTMLFSAWIVHSPAQLLRFTTPVGQPGTPGTLDGTNNNALFYDPAGMVMGPAGTLYVADGNAIRQVKITGTNWVLKTLAGIVDMHGPDDGTNSTALFDLPRGVALDQAGNIYVADNNNNAIRKVTPIGTNWVVTTLVGAGRFSPGHADGANTNGTFNSPYGIAIDAATNLYVADTYNHIVRKVSPVGTNWVVSTLAGLALTNGIADGSNSVARFNSPTDIKVDAATNLYVADYLNHTIRKIRPVGTNWVVTTIAGLGGISGFADGSNSVARFYFPQGLVLDLATNVYVTDSGNYTLRKVSPQGTNWVVTTLAGMVGVRGTSDGTNVLFVNPWGIALDTATNLYVTDNVDQSALSYKAETLRFGMLSWLLYGFSSGNQMVLSWSTNASGYFVESSSNLAPGSVWIPQTNGVVVSGTNSFLTNGLSLPATFYRLHKP